MKNIKRNRKRTQQKGVDKLYLKFKKKKLKINANK